MTRAHLYLARHGETDFNKEGRLQGHTDRPLNDTGRAQALALAERLRPLGITRVGASTLARATETASICAGALGVLYDYTDADLRERAYGVFEGLTRDDLRTQYPDAFRAWQEDNRFAPPGAETYEALRVRMVRAIVRAANETESRGGKLMMVSHGGAMRALVLAVTGTLPPPLVNGALLRVSCDGERITAID